MVNTDCIIVNTMLKHNIKLFLYNNNFIMYYNNV